MNIKKIEINGYYVWVDKSQQESVTLFYGKEPIKYSGKLIAASPELNLEGVPTYVEWLAEQYARKECEDMYNQISLSGAEWGWETKNDFTKGYQTAEKELFTEEEVRKAVELAREGLPIENPMYLEEEIIEQLKQEKDGSKIDKIP